MSCEVASWLPNAVAATLPSDRSAAPLCHWLNTIRDSIEEYDPVIVCEEEDSDASTTSPDSAFDEILSQLGTEIYKLEQYQRNLNPEETEVSLSILNLFDDCLGEMTELLHVNSDNCKQTSDVRAKVGVITDEVVNVATETVPIVNDVIIQDCSVSETSNDFATSTPVKMDVNKDLDVDCDSKKKPCPPPVPPRRIKPRLPSPINELNDETIVSETTAKRRESDSDSESTCWSYKECSTDENDNTKNPTYAVVWSHSTGFHNSDQILRKVLSQNHARVSTLSFDTVSDFSPAEFSIYTLEVVGDGDRCVDDSHNNHSIHSQSVIDMTPDRPTDDGYEPVRDAITTDENIYEEIEYSFTDEGCSCGGSVEVESCSISASSEGVGRDSPVYTNLRDHDAYAIPPDVIAWKNLLLHPFYNDDEEDEWITPEECAVYSREQRPPLVIPRITQYRARCERPVPSTGAASYPHDSYQESSVKSSVHRFERLHDWSPSSERGYQLDGYRRTGDSPGLNKRWGGSTENLLLNPRRPNHLQLAASSSGDSLDVEVRGGARAAARARKSRSMAPPRARSPVPAPRLTLQPAEAAVVHEGQIKRTKFSENNKKVKKNWTDGYMLLTQTALVFYKDQKTYYATKAPKPVGTPPSPAAPRAELVLPLRNAHVMPCTQRHTRRFTRSLVLTVGYDLYLLQDDSEEGARRWTNRIQTIIYKLGPPLLTDSPPPLSQSSNTDLESLGRTPPVARHPTRNKQKGGSSNEDLSDTTELSIQKSHVKNKLKKFFARRSTMEALVKKGIYKDEPVFGRNLDEVCPAASPRVPQFVVACIREIERSEENLCTDGLYRASGNLSQLQKIRLEVDQNNYSVIENNPDIHVLTGSLKLFFRELKQPLIPCSLFDRVLAACSLKPREVRQQEFREIVQALPPCNRDTLKYLLEHLLRVTKYSEQNRMHTANLAIVFGPTLLAAPPAQAHNIAVDCIQQNNVVDILLTDFNEIFAEDPNRVKRKT